MTLSFCYKGISTFLITDRHNKIIYIYRFVVFLTDEGLSLLLNTQSELRRLTLEGVPKVTGECFASLKCSKLWFVSLKLSDAIESFGISHLVQNCRRISNLNIGCCVKLNDGTLDCIAGYLLSNLVSNKLNFKHYTIHSDIL